MSKIKCKLSEVDKKDIESLFLSGETYVSIGNKYSITPSGIRYHIKNMGHSTPYRKKLNENEKNEIIEKFKTGNYSFRKLSIEYSVAPPSIRYFLIRAGYKAKSSSEISTKYKVDQDYFEKIDSNDKAYILGLLYADGCVHPSSNKLTISLQQGDKYLLDSIRVKISSNKPLYYSKPYSKISKKGVIINSHGHYSLVVINKKIITDLERHGVFQRKSKKLIFPNLEAKFISHFIRGFFDGDGGFSINKRNGGSLCFTANIEFLERIREHIIYNTSICNFRKIYKHIVSDIYYLTISRKQDIKNLYNWVYSGKGNLFLKRKKDKLEFFFRLKKID